MPLHRGSTMIVLPTNTESVSTITLQLRVELAGHHSTGMTRRAAHSGDCSSGCLVGMLCAAQCYRHLKCGGVLSHRNIQKETVYFTVCSTPPVRGCLYVYRCTFLRGLERIWRRSARAAVGSTYHDLRSRLLQRCSVHSTLRNMKWYEVYL